MTTTKRNRTRIPPLDGMLTVPIRRDEDGYVAQGRGFFIWDKNPDEVIRATKELLRGNLNVQPTQRFLLMKDAFVETCDLV